MRLFKENQQTKVFVTLLIFWVCVHLQHSIECCSCLNETHPLIRLDFVRVCYYAKEEENFGKFLLKKKYLLTPWSRVLLEKLTGSAASQEIPRIFGTRKFLTVLTSARHLSLS